MTHTPFPPPQPAGPPRPAPGPAGRGSQRAWQWLLLLALVLSGGCARAQSALVLDDAQASVKAWPRVTILSDPEGSLTLEDVRGRERDFAPPTGPEANLGTRADTVWLRLPLRVAGGDGRWVLDIDYPALNRVDVHLLRQGRPVALAVLGNAQPFDRRPMATRTHAMPLTLEPGQDHELLMRVSTSSAMVLPISLSKPDNFHARESHEQLLQGMLAGILGALMVYSLLHWVGLRDAMFLHYGLMLLGLGTFFFTYFGLANQYVWNHQAGLAAKAAPLGVLLALAAGSQFIAQALQLRSRRPGAWRGLMALSVLSAALLILSTLGLLDYRATQLAASVLGPLPMLFAIPLAYERARQGDPMARNMLLGWCAYMVGAVTTLLLLRGHAAVNFWTQHLFQFATYAEMLFWTRVLSLHIESIRLNAERALLEKQALVSLAHTDALTGLPNRRGLSLALDQALAQCRPDNLVAVYLLDLDGFKPINDQWGHDAGDALLVQVGERLRAPLRSADTVARLGGDEFVVMATGIRSDADALTLGRKMLAAFDRPFEVLGQPCKVGITIGFALAPHDGRQAADLLKRADAAMYAGKQGGRHCIQRGGASLAMAGH